MARRISLRRARSGRILAEGAIHDERYSMRATGALHRKVLQP